MAMDIRSSATRESKKSLRERVRHRILRGLAYYPMVVLLGVVLISIRATEELGAMSWIALLVASALVASAWLTLRRSPDPNPPLSQPWVPWATLGWMFAIGIPYSLLHDHARHEERLRVEEWTRVDTQRSQGDTAQPTGWRPIAVRASIEEPLRYRRATTPRSSPSDAPARGDDESASASEQWQTLTRIRVHQTRMPEGWSDSRLTASLVIDEKIRGLYPGDVLEIYGHWRLPPEPSNPGQFDLRKRYAELGLTAQMKAESGQQVQRIALGSPLRIDRLLGVATDRALRSVETHVPFGQAPLTAALVLGQREQSHWQLQEELLATGTIHMLSISGMHIEMVAVSLLVLGLLLRLPRNATLIGTVLLCGLYALLCGGNPPVARATLMLSAGCFARVLGWPFTSLNILALAGLLLLTQRTTIAFEIGTQLSFLTVAVLILTFPILNPKQSPLQRLVEARQSRFQFFLHGFRRFAWESFRSSFWVCFLSAPLVWSHFHILSPVAIALNLVLWLPMLIALLSGLALMVLGWVPPLASLLGMLCGGSLWVMTRVVALAESIPYSHHWGAAPPTWWLVAFYAMALGIAVWKGTRRASARRLLLHCLGIWFLLGLAYEPTRLALQRAIASPDRGSLAVTWIDVGHGTCAVIETPNGEVWLYDAGRLGDHERSYQPIVNSLWAMGRSRLDRMILSHADSDHYNAMPGVIKRFSPREWVTTEAVLQHRGASLQKLVREVQNHRVRIDTWHEGDRYYGRGSWSIEALHPSLSAESSRRDSNNSKSLCLLIHYAGRKILLPGDLEPPGTSQLTSKPPVHVDVMMAPHHGSLSAQADRVQRWASPDTVVISGSTRAVSQRVIDAFTPERGRLLITARDHAIRVEIQASGELQTLRWQSPSWVPVESGTSARY